MDDYNSWLHEIHCAELPPTGVHFWRHIGQPYGYWYVLIDGELQQRFYRTEAEARQALAKAKQRRFLSAIRPAKRMRLQQR